MDSVEKHNENQKIFSWTRDADTILAKVAKCTETLGTVHQGHILLSNTTGTR